MLSQFTRAWFCFMWSCPLRFAANEQGLLLASDVAARGLDIHKVQHVIHYHVPMNSDVRGGEGEEGRRGEGGREKRGGEKGLGVVPGKRFGRVPEWLLLQEVCYHITYRGVRCTGAVSLCVILCVLTHLSPGRVLLPPSSCLWPRSPQLALLLLLLPACPPRCDRCTCTAVEGRHGPRRRGLA